MATYRRSRDLGTVVASFNLDGETICVDIFERPDGSFGFEQYRRDAETGEGWFPIGFHSGMRCASYGEATEQACAAIGWLRDAMERA